MAGRGSEELNDFNSNCPSEPAMREVILGCAPRSTAQRVLDHLKSCGSCSARFDRLETELLDAPWVEKLDAPMSPYSSESSAQKIGERVKEVERAYLEESSEPGLIPNPSIDPFANLPLKLRDYTLLTLVGEGGMGLIFRAQHRRLNKAVAIKALRPDLMIDVKQLFEREIQAMARLDHPMIARATDAFEEKGRTFLVMEFIDGWNLSQVVARHGPLLEIDALLIIRQIALGMDFAHLQGWVHGDLKTSNVMLGRDGGLKILDLGLARSIQPERHETSRSDQEIPPVETSSSIDELELSGDVRVDISGLGHTLFRLLTGRVPLEAEPEEASLESDQRIDELLRYRPSASTETQKLYADLRTKVDSRRFLNMLGIVQAIDRIPLPQFLNDDGKENDSVHEISQALRRFRQQVLEGRVPVHRRAELKERAVSRRGYFDHEPILLNQYLSAWWWRIALVGSVILAIVALQLIATWVDRGNETPRDSAGLALSPPIAPPNSDDETPDPQSPIDSSNQADDPFAEFQPVWTFRQSERIKAEGGEVVDLRWTETQPRQLIVRSQDLVRTFPIDTDGERIDLAPHESVAASNFQPNAVLETRAFALSAHPVKTVLAFDPGTGEFATAVDRNRVVHVDWKSFRQHRGLPTLRSFEAICFIPQREAWAVADQGEIVLYDRSLLQALARLTIGQSTQSLTVSADGRWLLAELGPSSTPCVIEIREGQLLMHYLPRHAPSDRLAVQFWRGPIQNLESPNSSQDQATNELEISTYSPIVSVVFLVTRRMIVFHATTDHEGAWKWSSWESELGSRNANQVDRVPYLGSIDASSNVAVFANRSGDIEVWSLEAQIPLARFRSPYSELTQIQFDGSSNLLALASDEGAVAIYHGTVDSSSTSIDGLLRGHAQPFR